jgi:hypothetical protein
VKGTVKARTGGGAIHLAKIDGTIDASSGGGSIGFESGRLKGENRIETGGGSIKCRLDPGNHLKVDAMTAGGRVENEFGWPVEADSGEVTGTFGDGKEGTLLIRTGGGRISLRR